MRKSILFCLLFSLFFPGFFGQAQNDPLFQLIPGRESGISFINRVKDTKESNILIYSNFYEGAGVGIGDFNQDGLPDLFFAGNQVADRVYLNKGDLKFEDVTETAGLINNGGWSSGVIVADINNDGWPDVYVCRELYDDQPVLRKNKLYINNGISALDGTTPLFTECADTYGIGNNKRTRHATFLDFNNDGLLDLFLLNQPPNPGNFSNYYGTKPGPNYSPTLYKNTGKGHFEDVTEKAGLGKSGYGNSVSASDLNNDGLVDIYVANDFDSPDFVYINNGDGTFTNQADQVLKHMSFYSMGVDAADINNDGWLDVMVVDMVAEDNFRLKSNMSGMNPNTFWDVVKSGGHYQYMFNTLQLNNGLKKTSGDKGSLSFSDIGQMTGMQSTDWSWANLIADYDQDGFKDVYITNGLLRDIRNTDSDKKFSHYVEEVANDFVKNNPNAGDVSIWDILDLDEALKIVPSQKVANYAYKNNGDLTFSKVSDEWGLGRKSFSNGAAYADLDNDGDLDLVVNNVNEEAYLYRNTANEKKLNNFLTVKLTDKKDFSPTFGARIKVVIDGKIQIVELTNVRGIYSTSQDIAHFGIGDNEQIDELVVTWPDGYQVIKKNILPNQQLTIDKSESKSGEDLTANTPGTIALKVKELIDFKHQENNFDDFEKQVLLPHKMSQFGPSLAIADVNNDGMDDVFIGGASGQAGKLFFQSGSGKFTANKVSKVFESTMESEDLDAAFFDFDNDGDPDLYVVSGGNEWEPGNKNYQDRLYINDGKGNFTQSKGILPQMTNSGGVVRPFDFDQDGDIDLFISGRHVPWDYPAPASSTLLRNDGKKFVDVTDEIASDLKNIGLVTDAIWLDFNEDNHTDLILTGEWMPLTFIAFNGDKFTDDTNTYGIPGSNGWWYSIETADMDGDGDNDLIAGNLGLNYKYKGSPTEPFEVHYNDFDENGSKDIVLSYYNFGSQFPLRGRSCSSQQVPTIAEKFESYDLFAAADLVDVYGEADLNEALHYQATEFASMYLENKGNGKFTSKKLPNLAQVSSINDILVMDINKDSHQDIIIAGNLYTSEIETTRNDAGTGLILLGNSQGEFKEVAPYESNFYLDSDVKKLGIIRAMNKVFILAAVNDGETIAYEITSP